MAGGAGGGAVNLVNWHRNSRSTINIVAGSALGKIIRATGGRSEVDRVTGSLTKYEQAQFHDKLSEESAGCP